MKNVGTRYILHTKDLKVEGNNIHLPIIYDNVFIVKIYPISKSTNLFSNKLKI